MSFKTNNKGVKISNEHGKQWYHGSPYFLTTLKKGSSITRNKQLAVAFSHKPTTVSVNNSGVIEHNGSVNGYLYIIEKQLNEQDIYPHESCLKNDKWEWITTKNLRLKLICKTYL